MTVELLAQLGDDLTIVNAARVSFHRQATRTAEATLTLADQRLIAFLARERHGTPFEHVVFQFRVRTAIGVAREWFRHRIGSFNEESTRYVAMRPDFYLPEPAHVRTQVGTPGAYRFASLDPEQAEQVRETLAQAYAVAYQTYQTLLERGVARELARNVLPLGLLTEFIWTVNFRAVTNFLSLRAAPAALLEIRLEAEAVEHLVASALPVAYAAWQDGGRRPL